MKCLIIDDEPSGRKVMEELVAEADFLELVGKAENPVKANVLLNTHKDIDLLFLDVHMPKINGIDFLRSLRNPPMVILTTAFPEYALQGFELDSIDYLLKPISLERFLKACNKAREFHELRQAGPKPAAAPDYFFVKCSNRYEKILYDELLFVEAANNHVLLHTTTRRLISYLTFKGIEESLPADRFLKVHKSFIVAYSAIESLDGEDIRIGKHLVPISRNLKEEVMEKVLRNKLVKR